MEKEIPFKFTGPLDPEQDSFVSITRREELNEVIKGVSNQTYYALVGPRQTGKTTFLFQLMHEIRENLNGYQVIYLTLEDLVQIKPEEFYRSLVRKITTTLNHHYHIQPAAIKERYKTVNTNLDLKDFLLELARAKLFPPGHEESIQFETKEKKGLRYILLIDEIDAIPQEIMIEFVKTVRSIFIERLSVAGFKAYTMVLCGSADLASLTYGKTSPFNISKVIYLRDFTFPEIYQWLIPILGYLDVEADDTFVQKLFEQTNGHPYMTQLLCSRMLSRLQRERRQIITPADLREVDQIIIDGDINLLTTLERIKKDEFLQEMILKILKGDSIRYSRTHDIIYHLELAGAITKRGEFCKMRNTIYEKFFRQYFNLIDNVQPLKNLAVC
ncbi:MAG: AAA-like domain-containing protein [bacterium]